MDNRAALAAQHEELDRILEGASDADWQRPTRCPGWSVSDVVLHLAQSDEMALASLDGRFAEKIAEWSGPQPGASTIDEGAAAIVERDRGMTPQEVLARWRAAGAALRARFDVVDPSERVQWVTNLLSARTLATTRLSEAWIHTVDVAEALDVPRVPGPHLEQIVRLAWRTLPYAFELGGKELHGDVAVELDAPGGGTWAFGDATTASTVVRGPATEFCEVAARRLDPAASRLTATGPDADDVLALVRTYA